MTRAAGIFLALFASTAFAQAPKTPGADKAIADAVKALEGAIAAAATPADQAKLRAAVAALRSVTATAVQNDLASDFLDNPAKYKNQTLTFRVTLHRKAGTSLRELVGDSGPFEVTDSKNGAKGIIGVKIPPKFPVPAAQPGDEVVITFTANGTTNNLAPTEIRRP